MGKRKDTYITAVDGTAWKYWNSGWVNIITGLTNADAESIDFMDKTILVNGTDNKYWDGSTTGDVATMPDAHFLAVHDNRMYSANKDNQNLNFSSLRKYNDWTTVNDAGTIVTETRDGLGCSGLTVYKGHVVYFKNSFMTELFGNGPDSYKMQTVSEEIGCLSHRSICEVDGNLYWLSNEGIRAYSGGTLPELVSIPVQDHINAMDKTNASKAAAGTDGFRYYISLPVNSNERILLTYDTRYQIWYAEDSTDIVQFVRFGSVLYGLTSDGQIKKMNDPAGTESVSWYAVMKPTSFDRISGAKTFKNAYVVFSMPSGSKMSLAVSESAEGGTYTTLYNYTASNEVQNVKAMIPLKVGFSANWLKFKLSGTGPCTIHKIEIQARVKPNGW
jgi:hypothetical protein